MEILPCPFCGERRAFPMDEGCHVYEECPACGAEGPTCTDESDAIAAWNRRAPDPLREALLWHWAAEHNAHDWNDCGEDNDATGPGDIPCRTCAEIADMREAAAAEVERLLSSLERVR